MRDQTALLKAKQERFEALLDRFNYDPQTGAFTWARYVKKGHGMPGLPAGSKSPSGYVRLCIDGVQMMAHRVAWRLVHGRWPEDEVDHINGTRDDNRIANLREASRAINSQNLRSATKASRSGMLGVSWSKHRRKWVAYIKSDGKTINLGGFKEEAAAQQTYITAKRQLHAGTTL